MSTFKNTDIETLLERWEKVKFDIANMQEKLAKYKKLASKVMSKRDTEILCTPMHTLKRKQITRRTISKRDVPDHIWEQYSKTCTYPAFYLTNVEG